MKKKVSSLLIITIIGVILFLFSTNNSEQTSLDNNSIHKAKLGIYNGDTSLLAIIAKEKGFFKEENLDLELKKYPSGYHAMTGMLNGEVDYSNCAEFVAAKYSFSNKNFKILASMAVANINGAVAKVSKGINTPLDMKNKRIGTAIGTVSEYYTGVFLEYNKLSHKDVSILNVHPKKGLEVFQEDSIDVLFAWEPTIFNLQKKYKEEVNFFPMPLGFEFYFLLVSDDKFHQKNPMISSKILKALYKAQNYIKENPKEIKSFVKNYFNFDDKYIDYILSKHKFELTFPYVLSSVLQNQFKWLKSTGLAKGESVKLDELYDTSILNKIDNSAVTILE